MMPNIGWVLMHGFEFNPEKFIIGSGGPWLQVIGPRIRKTFWVLPSNSSPNPAQALRAG